MHQRGEVSGTLKEVRETTVAAPKMDSIFAFVAACCLANWLWSR